MGRERGRAAMPYISVSALSHEGLVRDHNEDSLVIGPWTLCATVTESPQTLLFPLGTPPRATIGNSTFALGSRGNQPFQPNLLLCGQRPGASGLEGCILWAGLAPGSVVLSDASGLAVHRSPIPDDSSLEGRVFHVQAVGRDPINGRIHRLYELSEGLQIRVGSSIADSERRLILATLDQLEGDKKRTAEVLGISLKTLYNRLNVYAAADRTKDPGSSFP